MAAATKFGRAVRRWRERVSPEAAGLPAGGPRRAPGLRREELALLAGISVDYVTRLEQGRARHPSEQVVEALGRALRLNDREREHLFHVAGLVPPGRETVPATIAPGVQRLLDRLSGTPVAVFDAAWTLLLANPLYTALMGDVSRLRGLERNNIWRHFLTGGSRVRASSRPRDEFEAALVGDLRMTAGRYPADQRLNRLIGELRAGSERFRALWDAGTVGTHETSRKTIDHPEVGALTLDCDVLLVAASDVRIMVYSAEPGTGDADRLALLSVLGTQTLTEREP
ncbi:helix-turn-helix transcriptional regulator [Streptomyces sp. NPDC050560]|uniref:helix-turn-helix transcriptional regulator n=1 Tax=Streptomyces sp. NPDC050560 TaxID=3365630 RepID=UPI0037A254A2